jgi:hypothetical protein
MAQAVLIIFMGMGYGQYDIKFQEFSNMERCVQGMEVIKNMSHDKFDNMMCVVK